MMWVGGWVAIDISDIDSFLFVRSIAFYHKVQCDIFIFGIDECGKG